MEELKKKNLGSDKTLRYIVSDPEFIESQKWDLKKFNKIIDKVEIIFRDMNFSYKELQNKIENEKLNKRQVKKEVRKMREAFENHHIAIELKNTLPKRLFEEFDRMEEELQKQADITSKKESVLWYFLNVLK